MGHVVQPVDGLTEGKADLNFSRKLEVEEGPAGQETRAVAESLLTVPEEGPRLATPCRATWGSIGDPQEAEGGRVRHGQEPLLWLLWGRQGKTG